MDNGLTEYLKQRVSVLVKRNKELMSLKGYVLHNYPEILVEYVKTKGKQNV